jgi:hypothetical protein
MRPLPRKLLLIAPLVCASIPLLWLPFAEYAAVSSWGSDYFLHVSMVLILPLIAAFCIFVAGSIALLFRRARGIAFVCLLCAAAYCVAFLLANNIGYHIRMNGFKCLAERSKPLVRSIHGYEKKYGHPPETLQALVPEFISSIPSTGMAAYPEFEYVTGNLALDYNGNPWVLYIFTPSGGINFDQFMYFPLQNYPKTGYGGWLEMVGEWAYVHE